MADEVTQFDINMLQPNPLQPRGSINSETLVDLVDSIKEHGIMQPLVVAKTPAGYQIIAGERRWRASKLAGLTHVPVIIRETTPRGMLEMALVENVQRVDLNSLDRAKGFERLQAEFALSTSEIAAQIGKSVAYVSNSLRLLSLPDALKDGLLSGLISEGHARALAAIDDPQLMVEAYKIILRESGSVRRAEELARRMKSQAGQAPRITGSAVGTAKIMSETFEKMEKEMLDALAHANGDESKKPPVVKLARSQRETKLLFVLKGNVEETDAQLQKIYQAVTA
jgi:ParB family transcriptional regulator, chromosome partitioning protein